MATMLVAAPQSPSDPFVRVGGDMNITAKQIKLDSQKLATLVARGKTVEFDPLKHLAYSPPSKRYSLTDIGLDPNSTDNQNKAAAVMDFAYTEPFRLLSDEGVEAMRKAVYSEEVLKNCPFKVKDSTGADYTHWELRNTSKQSKFIRDFWKSSKVTSVVADALQYDIVPTMDVELGHVNLQTPVMEEKQGVTGWHTDENCQFVCILMLSDAKNMVGGETAFRKGDGSIALVKYPAAGYAICMQGLNILHSVTNVQAADGERMSMVTSYQPRDYKAPQNGHIKALHPLGTEADRLQMCSEYTSWRMHVLSERLADLAAEVEEGRKEGKFDLALVTEKAAAFTDFLGTTVKEVTPDV